MEEPIVCMSKNDKACQVILLELLIVSLYSEGIFKRWLFVKAKLNHQFYIEVLMDLMEVVWRKCPEKWHTQDWLFHHKNAPAHMVFVYSTVCK